MRIGVLEAVMVSVMVTVGVADFTSGSTVCVGVGVQVGDLMVTGELAVAMQLGVRVTDDVEVVVIVGVMLWVTGWVGTREMPNVCKKLAVNEVLDVVVVLIVGVGVGLDRLMKAE